MFYAKVIRARIYELFNFAKIKGAEISGTQNLMGLSYSSHYPMYPFFVLQYRFCFCFTLEVKGALFLLVESYLHEKFQTK